MNTLGNIIRILREEKGLQQKELAKIIHVERSTMSNYEKDKRTPNMDTLIKIADYFDVSIDYLLGILPPRYYSKEVKFELEFKDGKRILNKREVQIIINKYEALCEKVIDFTVKVNNLMNE